MKQRLDPDDCCVVAHCCPTDHIDHRLMRWLCEFGIAWKKMSFSNVRGIPVAYNQGVRMALATKKQHLIFVDHDVIPQPRTDAFWDETDADVVCCPCHLDIPGEWANPDAFHCGLWRITREALLKISPPWFHFVYTEDGTAFQKCVCEYFADKAREAGLTITRAGWAGHPPRGVTEH